MFIVVVQTQINLGYNGVEFVKKTLEKTMNINLKDGERVILQSKYTLIVVDNISGKLEYFKRKILNEENE